MPNDAEAKGKVGYRIDYAAPSEDLAPYLGGFHGFHTYVGPGVKHEEIFLPAWASIRFQTTGGDWSMRIGERNHDPVPRRALFGPLSRSGVANVTSGHIVGVYLLPRAWARLMACDAKPYADRITPLEEIWGEEAFRIEQG